MAEMGGGRKQSMHTEVLLGSSSKEATFKRGEGMRITLTCRLFQRNSF
jgi:hypothetical protein